MLKSLAMAGFAVLAASPAGAQCLSIPDGVGGAAIHCHDGRIGHMSTDVGGGVTGMIGAQVFTGSAAQVTPGLSSGVPAPSPVNPDIAARPVLVPPPPLSAVQPPQEWGRRIVDSPDPLFAAPASNAAP